MSIYENLKKVFSELVQFWELLLKCSKREQNEGKVVTDNIFGSFTSAFFYVSLF